MKPRYMAIRLPESFPAASDQEHFIAACRMVSMTVAALAAQHPNATQADRESCDVGLLVVHPDSQADRALYKTIHRELGTDPTPQHGWHESRVEYEVGGFDD